jgi:predicted transcriptional regulator
MPPSVVELAKELTVALIETGNVRPHTMQETLQKTHATLTALKVQEEEGQPSALPAAEPVPVDWRTSITRHAITCLECGQTRKQLSIRHLRLHGLDPRAYRVKYGIPSSQPLAAWKTIARRRQLVRETRPWEKAPTYLKGQARQGTAAPEPETEAAYEETEEVRATTPPAQAKRQRKTPRKKQAAG